MTLNDFGTDRHAVYGMRFRLVSGLENLGIALLRRLKTPRGGLFYDPFYGSDIRDYLNRSYSQNDSSLIWEIEQVTVTEVMKDPRVFSASATLTVGTIPSREVSINLSLQTALGPFKLVINADNLTSEVLKIENA
jgi:phage baseplate assembly protein W